MKIQGEFMNLLEKGISRPKIFWEIESFARVSHDERCCWKNRRLEGEVPCESLLRFILRLVAFRLDFAEGLGDEPEAMALFLPIMRQVFAQP
jgi:hypothetical protein